MESTARPSLLVVTLLLLLLFHCIGSALICSEGSNAGGRRHDQYSARSSRGEDFEWESHGNGRLNQRRAKRNSRITAATVSGMRRRWAFPTGFDVSATPAVAEGMVYFPGWNGMLYAVDERTGELRWQFDVQALQEGEPGTPSNGSRTTPAVWGDLLLVGMLGPPRIIAIDRHSGCLLWMSDRLDPATYAVITMSGTAFDGFFYVGTSSYEESRTCCTFQGSFFKMKLSDGSVVWRTPMLPPNSGYFGAALWGSSPSIDPKRRLLFIATGNNYKVPESVELCESERLKNATLSSDTCLDPENHQDSILALNMDDGSIVWSRNLQAYDAWTYVCQLSPTTPNCPLVLGPDYDFGEAPMIICLDDADAASTSTHNKMNGSEVYNNVTCIVVAAQKSGFVWALDCDTGFIVWSTAAGPGSALGGASWGSCSDGERVYTNIANYGQKNFTLAPGSGVTSGGGWVAMDATTGEVLWTTAEPSGAFAFGPVSVSEGVVFATAYTDSGDVYALDALTGAILWHNATGAAIYGGVSISRSCIFVGNGYHNNRVVYNGTAVIAFCLPDE